MLRLFVFIFFASSLSYAGQGDLRTQCYSLVNHNGGMVGITVAGDYWVNFRSSETDFSEDIHTYSFTGTALKTVREASPFIPFHALETVRRVDHTFKFYEKGRISSYGERTEHKNGFVVNEVFNTTYDDRGTCLVDSYYVTEIQGEKKTVTIRKARSICEEWRASDQSVQTKKALFLKMLAAAPKADRIQTVYLNWVESQFMKRKKESSDKGPKWIMRAERYATIDDASNPNVLDLVFAEDGRLCPSYDFMDPADSERDSSLEIKP